MIIMLKGDLSNTLVLGIDPGTATTGYGLVQVRDNGDLKLIKSGLIETDKDGDPGKRLAEIHRSLTYLMEKYSPQVVVMEKVFFFSNAKTVIRVSQAQGVLLLAAAQAKIPVFEYAPGQIKLVVGGSGKADKEQMKKSVFNLFKVKAQKNKKTHFDNEADAIAIAVCHSRLTNNGNYLHDQP